MNSHWNNHDIDFENTMFEMSYRGSLALRDSRNCNAYKQKYHVDCCSNVDAYDIEDHFNYSPRSQD